MSKHFEFTGETRGWHVRLLHRIRATQDLPEHGVKAGELGGWVEHEENLQDHAWVFDDAKVYDEARLCDTAEALGNAIICGNAVARDSAIIRGNAQLSGHAEASHCSIMQGNAILEDRARITDYATMYGSARGSGNALIGGDAQIGASIALMGNAKVEGDVRLCHWIDISSACHITKDSHIMIIGPIGSENQMIVFARPQDLTKPVVEIGCWTGPLDHMMTEVHKRAKRWRLSPNTTQMLVSEYESAHQLLEARLQTWLNEEKS